MNSPLPFCILDQGPSNSTNKTWPKNSKNTQNSHSGLGYKLPKSGKQLQFTLEAHGLFSVKPESETEFHFISSKWILEQYFVRFVRAQQGDFQVNPPKHLQNETTLPPDDTLISREIILDGSDEANMKTIVLPDHKSEPPAEGITQLAICDCKTDLFSTGPSEDDFIDNGSLKSQSFDSNSPNCSAENVPYISSREIQLGAFKSGTAEMSSVMHDESAKSSSISSSAWETEVEAGESSPMLDLSGHPSETNEILETFDNVMPVQCPLVNSDNLPLQDVNNSVGDHCGDLAEAQDNTLFSFDFSPSSSISRQYEAWNSSLLLTNDPRSKHSRNIALGTFTPMIPMTESDPVDPLASIYDLRPPLTARTTIETPGDPVSSAGFNLNSVGDPILGSDSGSTSSGYDDTTEWEEDEASTESEAEGVEKSIHFNADELNDTSDEDNAIIQDYLDHMDLEEDPLFDEYVMKWANNMTTSFDIDPFMHPKKGLQAQIARMQRKVNREAGLPVKEKPRKGLTRTQKKENSNQEPGFESKDLQATKGAHERLENATNLFNNFLNEADSWYSSQFEFFLRFIRYQLVF
jgi:hypothetical protein